MLFVVFGIVGAVAGGVMGSNRYEIKWEEIDLPITIDMREGSNTNYLDLILSFEW